MRCGQWMYADRERGKQKKGDERRERDRQSERERDEMDVEEEIEGAAESNKLQV